MLNAALFLRVELRSSSVLNLIRLQEAICASEIALLSNNSNSSGLKYRYNTSVGSTFFFNYLVISVLD